MSFTYRNSNDALASKVLGAKTLTTFDAAAELTGKPAKNVDGVEGYYSTPMRAVDGYCVGVVLPLPGGVDGLGRPIVDGLLVDLEAIKSNLSA